VSEPYAELLEEAAVRTCRQCGCTTGAACEGGCSWVEEDLCSACIGVCGHCGSPDCTRMGGMVLCLPPGGEMGPEDLE
jgi:hypothetical protein